MGRRRQHSGGLALASDQIPGHNHHNIDSGLVSVHAWLPGLSQSSKAMLLQQTQKRQAENESASARNVLLNRQPVPKAVDAKIGEPHVTCRKVKTFSLA